MKTNPSGALLSRSTCSFRLINTDAAFQKNYLNSRTVKVEKIEDLNEIKVLG